MAIISMTDNSQKLSISARNLSMHFGGVKALDEVNLDVVENQSLAIIGPNGAGKSTLLSLIAGSRKPTSGSLDVLGQDVTGLQGHRMARHGVSLAHQVPKPFRNLTVRENLDVAAQVLRGGKERKDSVISALRVCGLEGKAHRSSGSLGLLDLKRLELARAFATKPKIILLDEVAAGLNGKDLSELIELLTQLRTYVPTLVFVEHVQEVVHEIAEHVIVLDWGRKIAEGTPKEIAQNEEVIESYLGTESALIKPAIPYEYEQHELALEVKGLSASYGQIKAIDSISFDLRPGEIVSVLGANGAGKSTLALSLMGAVAANGGQVFLKGKEITGLSPHDRVSSGIAICPEGRRLFPNLTVEQNLELGLIGSKNRSQLDVAYELFPKLHSLSGRLAGTLSGGEQQMVAISRAIASNPSVVIFDEVSLGLAPIVVDRLYEAILKIQSWGTSIIMVEQNIHRAVSIAHRVLLLQQGKVLHWGDPNAMSEESYLGAYLGIQK